MTTSNQSVPPPSRAFVLFFFEKGQMCKDRVRKFIRKRYRWTLKRRDARLCYRERSLKTQIRNETVLVVFTVTTSKTKIKTVECLKPRISEIIEYR